VSAESTVRIALLLPDVLGTYSDRGNAEVLVRRLRWRGLPAETVDVTAGMTPPTACDVFVLGGGEDAAQVYATEWLCRWPALLTAMSRGQVLAVCAGLQVLGMSMRTTEGRLVPGAELVDVTTTPGRVRAVGEVVARGTDPALGALIGFENHRGHTSRGPGLPPLGQVDVGIGNGDGTDGVLTATLVGTYLHGPVLARNPALADLILSRVTGIDSLPDLQVPDVAAARAAHVAAAAASARRRGWRMRGSVGRGAAGDG
jgi:lipid II isoglutaminyl synthase (glutamine-hydrolysing)